MPRLPADGADSSGSERTPHVSRYRRSDTGAGGATVACFPGSGVHRVGMASGSITAGLLRLHAAAGGRLVSLAGRLVDVTAEFVSLLRCMNYQDALAVLGRSAAACCLLSLAGAGLLAPLLLLLLLLPLLLLGSAAGWRWPGVLERLRRWLCAPAASELDAGRNGDPTLLRPLGFMESGVATAHTYGSSNIVYALRMHGRRPVCSDDVLRALTIIQGRIQNLRLCIREAYGRRYFAEMRAPRVLFSVHEEDDWMQEYESQLQAVFDTAHGPLWSASLLTLPGVNNANSELYDANRPDEEPKPYPFVAMLVLTFCHAISDGSSNALFCHQFLDVLNKVIDGAAVPQVPDIKLRAPLEDMPLAKQKQYDAGDIASLATHLWDLVFAPRNHYLAAFPPPRGCKEIRMRTHSLVLSAEQTRRLLDRCRAEGVTVHAAFTVAASLALHELIRTRRPELAQLNVRSGHVVNFRRYLQRQHQDVYGCYMGFFEASVRAGPDGRRDFWQLARTAVAEMKHRLDAEMQPVTYCRLMQTFISTERWVHRQHTKEMPHVSHYFGTSNMGNLDRLFDATGKHVEVTQLVRTTNIGHDLGMVFAHMFHTLRGRLMYNLDYLVAAISEPHAREYAEKTLEILTTAV